MAQATTQVMSKPNARKGVRVAALAWLLVAVCYFYQYVLRSAPSVMMPQLSEAFGLSAMGVASIVGLFYYGYSAFSLVAGASLDLFGPRKVLPVAAVAIAVGALSFASGSSGMASIGRFLQGVGGAFSIVGAIYSLEELPSVQCGHLDRRYADVWHGWRIGRTVRSWAAHR